MVGITVLENHHKESLIWSFFVMLANETLKLFSQTMSKPEIYLWRKGIMLTNHFSFVDCQKLRLGFSGFLHFVGIWHASYGVCLPFRHHRRTFIQEPGGTCSNGYPREFQAQQFVPQLLESQDWQVGTTAYIHGSSGRLLLRISTQGMATQWKNRHGLQTDVWSGRHWCGKWTGQDLRLWTDLFCWKEIRKIRAQNGPFGLLRR